MTRKLLEGVKIADFCWVWVGPMTTKTLGDQGAEVIRIESKARPGVWRVTPPFKDNVVGFNRGGVFNVINTSKRSVTLNLSNPRGVEIAKRLVAWADVVTENFAGGTMEKMGLGYEDLNKVKPDIIMLSAAMMGQTGPHSRMPGFGAHLTAISGFSQVAGWPDRQPGDLGHYTDFIAPRYNALAIMAALDYRRRTGKGQYLDMAQIEGCMNLMAPHLLDYTVNERVPKRAGNTHPDAAPHGAYRCRGMDRWCVIAVFTDEEWDSFRSVIGNPAWTADHRFATLAGRKDNEEELNRLVDRWTLEQSAEDVMDVMQAAGVAAGVVQGGEDLYEHDAHLGYREYYPEIEHPEMGKYFTVAPPYKLSKAPAEPRRAPLMGEDNEYVFKEILGMSDDEVAELVVEGVVE
jgi:crotonobetainyl-CoA:carnitine CoA-transferase CaiB-like acyl-CoA transferase